MTRVSVVIPTWRRARWLDRCLRSVLDGERGADEVLVVGRSDDVPARSVIANWAGPSAERVRWVEVDGPGHVAPVRRGLDAATGDVVAFLDDDADPDPGWLAALLRPFEDNRVACAGGRVFTLGSNGIVHSDAGRVRLYGKYIGNIGALETPTAVTVDAVMEGNWAWRADVLRSLRFDPVLDFDDASMYGLDLCLQAATMGYRVVYEPAARVLHHAAPRDGRLDRKNRAPRNFAYSRNYTYIALKHLKGLRRALFCGWWWLVGERGSYGAVKAAADLALRGPRKWTDVAASFAGKREGVRLWRASLR
jgi:GT2 family glycosyltransferase